MSVDAVENELCQGYAEQVTHYERALTLTRTASSANDNDWLPALLAELDRIGAIVARMAPGLRSWKAQGVAAGAKLQAQLDQVASLIEALQAEIERHRVEVETRKRQLLPQIDGFVRLRQMQSAYGLAGRKPRSPAQGRDR